MNFGCKGAGSGQKAFLVSPSSSDPIDRTASSVKGFDAATLRWSGTPRLTPSNAWTAFPCCKIIIIIIIIKIIIKLKIKI